MEDLAVNINTHRYMYIYIHDLHSMLNIKILIIYVGRRRRNAS